MSTVQDQIAQHEATETAKAHALHAECLREIGGAPPDQCLSRQRLDELVALRRELGFTGSIDDDVAAVVAADNLQAAADVAEAAYKRQPAEGPLHERIAEIDKELDAAKLKAESEKARVNAEISRVWTFRDEAKRARGAHAHHVGAHDRLLRLSSYELWRRYSADEPASVRRGAVNTGDYSGVGLRGLLNGKGA